MEQASSIVSLTIEEFDTFLDLSRFTSLRRLDVKSGDSQSLPPVYWVDNVQRVVKLEPDVLVTFDGRRLDWDTFSQWAAEPGQYQDWVDFSPMLESAE